MRTGNRQYALMEAEYNPYKGAARLVSAANERVRSLLPTDQRQLVHVDYVNMPTRPQVFDDDGHVVLRDEEWDYNSEEWHVCAAGDAVRTLCGRLDPLLAELAFSNHNGEYPPAPQHPQRFAALWGRRGNQFNVLQIEVSRRGDNGAVGLGVYGDNGPVKDERDGWMMWWANFNGQEWKAVLNLAGL